MDRMRITSRTRVLAAATGLLVLLGGSVLAAPAGPAAAAGTPTISFSPAGPFRGGETVSVTVAGIVPTDRVVVAQCAPSQLPNPIVPASGCAGDQSPWVSATASSVTVALTVRQGFLGPDQMTVCNIVHDCHFVARVTTQGSGDPLSDRVVSKQIPFVYSDGETSNGTLGVSYAPMRPLTAGATVTVTATGMTPHAPVALAQCGRDTAVNGPADCAPAARGASKLVMSDQAGVARATLQLIVGPLLNERGPATVCSATDGCKVVAINIADQTITASTPIAIAAGAVTPKVGVALSKKSVKKGKATTFKGKVGPNQARQKVRLQRKVGKKWVTVKTARLGMDSRYAVTLRPKSRKDYYWRVLLPKTAFHKVAVSKKRKLTVR